MSLGDRAAVFVLPHTGFSSDAFNAVTRVLGNHRVKLDVATVDGKDAESNRNRTVLTDHAVTDVSAEDVDVVVLVGGPDTAAFLEREPVYDRVEDAVDKDTVVAAVGEAALVLAKLSVLADRDVAGIDALEEAVDRYGYTVTEDAVTVDELIVTGTVERAERVGEEIAALLQTAPAE